jgi:hypothetical protein
MRTTAIVSAVVLSSSVLTGCGGGGSSTDAYCKDLKAAKADFASLDSSTPDFDKFGDVIVTFHKLAKSAPPKVSEEWKTLDGALTTLEKDLQDAGLTMKDLGPLSQGQMPEGMTADDLAKLGPTLEKAFGKLDDAKFKKASDTIEKHAKSECNVDLTSG